MKELLEVIANNEADQLAPSPTSGAANNEAVVHDERTPSSTSGAANNEAVELTPSSTSGVANNEADELTPSPTSGGSTTSIRAPNTGSGSVVSSPVSVHSLHRLIPAEQSPPVQDDEVSSPSSTHSCRWLRECALELKDTEAAKDWKFIGRRLGLSEATIHSIESKHGRDIEEAFYQMMLSWRKTMGEQATCDALIEALIKQKQRAVAERVEKYRQYD